MNRGSQCEQTCDATRCAGFNEAPIHESGKLRHVVLVSERAPASMRPRFMNRGSQRPGSRGHFRRGASMRPRFMNRGSGMGRTGNP